MNRPRDSLGRGACLVHTGALFLALSSDPILALDFRYFRHDAGIAPAEAGPLPGDLGATRALRWRSPLDSGHSSPIPHAGKIFLTTFRETDRQLATVALDPVSGRILWRQPVPTTFLEEVHPQKGNPATATPACDGQRIYAFFGSYGLLCYDLDGHKLWEHRLGPFRDEYGAGSSPVLVDDLLVLNQDHDIDSFLIALDRATGRVVWNTPRPAAVRSYATPVVWMSAGRPQLLVAGALELAAYDPATGRKIWWVNGLARIVIPVPAASGDTVYAASWAPGADAGARLALPAWADALQRWDKNRDTELARNEISDPEVLDRFFRMDLNQDNKLDSAEWDRHAQVFRLAQNAALALRPTGRGDLTETAVRWQYRRGVPYVASPLVHNGIFWMVKDGGIVTKLDAASGQPLQEERLPAVGSYYASPVCGDGKVYFASETGVVTVVADQREWRPLATHSFNEKVYATPAIDQDRLYLRTDQALYCFQGGRPVERPAEP